MFDGTALGKQVVDIVKGYVSQALEPIMQRLQAIEQRPAPVSVTGAVIDRGGNLVLTHSDGSTKDLGIVVGQDAKGQDGADGMGFDDLAVDYDGERTLTLRFVRGDRTKEFPFTLPMVIDRGVWADGKSYDQGDGVTWGGSFWIAQKETADKPGSGDGWRLSVKKGRDAKQSVQVS